MYVYRQIQIYKSQGWLTTIRKGKSVLMLNNSRNQLCLSDCIIHILTCSTSRRENRTKASHWRFDIRLNFCPCLWLSVRLWVQHSAAPLVIPNSSICGTICCSPTGDSWYLDQQNGIGFYLCVILTHCVIIQGQYAMMSYLLHF